MSDMAEFKQWINDMAGDPKGDWHERTPAGTRERPYVADGVRRVTLVYTDAGEWGVIEHGGWTESPIGAPIGKFTANYGADWYPSEDEARAAYLLASGQVDHAALVKLVAANVDEIEKLRDP